MLKFINLCKITVLATAVFIASVGLANAQTTVEAGLSVGFNRHSLSVQEGSGMLRPGIALTGTYGIPIVIRKNSWEIHTGFYANDLSQSFYFVTPNGATFGKNSFSNGISSFKIPLRIGRSIQWTNVISLSPQVGFSWLTNQRTDRTGSGGGNYGRVEYRFENRAVNKNKFMAEAGLDVNFSVFHNLILTLGAQYSLGLQTVQKFDVTYQINDRSYEGTVNSKGSGWKFNLSLKVPLYGGGR